MKKIILLASCILLFAFSIVAQVSGGGKPYSFTNALPSLSKNATIVMPALDVPALQRQARDVIQSGKMLPAGQIFPVSLNFGNSGEWTVLPNMDRVWRLMIEVPDAPATSLYFDNFYIPEGGTLYVYNAERTQLIGSFDYHNNNESKTFATEIVYTEACVIEYYEKNNVKRAGSFTITGIANVYNAPKPPAYIQLQHPKSGYGTAGTCEVNVNCPEGSGWVNQRNAVVRILVKHGGSQGWASGVLINTVPGTCTNYILSANHCGAAASSTDKGQWVFYFNYQGPGCTNPASEPGSNTFTGCTMRSSSSNGTNSDVTGSDFLLVELMGTIPASYNAYYAGFDATNTASNGGVGIHHPAGDTKKISAYTAAVTSRRFYSQLPDNSHWQANWVATATNYGVTEGGSSGSPLYNVVGNIVGQLSGGPSYCGAAAGDKNDYYGKMSYNWTSNGASASQQLKPWLDPNNTGTLTVAGRTPCTPPVCPDIMEANNTQATAQFIQINVPYRATIATSTDQDYYKFAVGNGTNVVLALSTLPFDYDMQLLNSSGTVVGSSAAGGTANENITYNNAPADIYTVRISGYNGAFSSTSCYTLLATLTAACNNTPEPNESMAAAVSIPPNGDFFSQIGTSTDNDYYKFSNVTGASNIYVTLTNLPADYDIYLYNSAGTVIGSSAAGSTTNESIIYNTNTIGLYYIRVFGFNGAFNTSVCYNLRASLSGTTKETDARPGESKGNLLTLSPNPAASKITLTYSAGKSSREQLIITDVYGRKVYAAYINSVSGRNDQGIILPSGMASGIYFVKMGDRVPVKFVKE